MLIVKTVIFKALSLFTGQKLYVGSKEWEGYEGGFVIF